MMFPSPQDRGLVVFLVWNRLALGPRLALSLGLISVGLILQLVTLQWVPGLPLLLLGNLFLLVRGVNNRVDFGKFDPSAQWEPVPADRLEQLFALDRRMVKWDRSVLDGSNLLGGLVLVLMLAAAAVLVAGSRGAAQILAIDAAALLVPHWLTGMRSVMRRPSLMAKAQVFRKLLRAMEALTAGHKVQLLFLLQGEARVPADIKFKVTPSGAPPEFLGIYGQLVMNRVQGSVYPYFYTVLVAKTGFGMVRVAHDYQPPRPLIRELKHQNDVEVLVIRQHTTKTSGYHTKPATMARLVEEAVTLSQRLAPPVAQ